MRKKSLTILNGAAFALAIFTIAVGALALLPGGKELVEGNFGVLRVIAYAGWGAGVLVLTWAGVLAAGLERPSLGSIRRAWRDTDLVRVRRALGVAFAGNAAALAVSPLGLFLGERYTWSVYVGHLALSLVVVALTGFVCLVRLRAFVDDTAPAPIPVPARAGFVEPTGF